MAGFLVAGPRVAGLLDRGDPYHHCSYILVVDVAVLLLLYPCRHCTLAAAVALPLLLLC